MEEKRTYRHHDHQSKDDLEDDENILVMTPHQHQQHSAAPSRASGKFLALDLGRAARGHKAGEGEADTAADRISGEHETDVTIVFELPDGSRGEQEFKLGQTVEVLKSYVESEFGIPMQRQELYLGTTAMMDPMTLLDYPDINERDGAYIIVEGEMGAEAKK
eukprot:TRINITY_DN26311_c0_g1_i1.p1 TRINITY_DN26311_c0_g1~~TRINITY_DN26311_c0_g1_i1.p1  ORF type:complete len:162 (+),score=38.10 TRINITY_DN26311_c0_g1_i1:77-562(+)